MSLPPRPRVAYLLLVRRSHAARSKRPTPQDKAFLVHRRSRADSTGCVSALGAIARSPLEGCCAKCPDIHRRGLHWVVRDSPGAAGRELFYAATHHSAHPIAYSRDYLFHLSADF